MNHYARFIKSYSFLDDIVIAIQSQMLDVDQLMIDNKHEFIFGKNNIPRISIYQSENEPLSIGCSMTAVAFSIGSTNFSLTKSKKEINKNVQKNKNYAILVLNGNFLNENCSVVHSPENCKTFFPASSFHYDINYGEFFKQKNIKQVLEIFIDIVLNQFFEIISCENFNGNLFECQAKIIYEYCCKYNFFDKDYEENQKEQLIKIKNIIEAIQTTEEAE